MPQQALNTFEIWSLVLQIIGTVATVAACVGIYYAEKSLYLAGHDYRRKLRLETGVYARQIMKDLQCYVPLLHHIDREKLTSEQIRNWRVHPLTQKANKNAPHVPNILTYLSK